MMNEIKLTGESKNIVFDNISKLKEIFPEVITENKIDFKKLELVLGENIDVSHEKYSFTWPGTGPARGRSAPTSRCPGPRAGRRRRWSAPGSGR